MIKNLVTYDLNLISKFVFPNTNFRKQIQFLDHAFKGFLSKVMIALTIYFYMCKVGKQASDHSSRQNQLKTQKVPFKII